MIPTTTVLRAAAVSLAVATGCVSQGRYDQAVSTTQTTRAELAKRNAELAKKSAALSDLQAQLDARTLEIAYLRGEISDARAKHVIDRLHSGGTIADLEKRLDDLEAQQAAALTLATTYRAVYERLKAQIDAGDLDVVIRDGRMVLRLPNDVLFDTGRTEVKKDGRSALEAVAGVLASMSDRHFQIAGHTDDVPIANDRFASNWELSMGRALRVMRLLESKGVSTKTLSAAAYADVDPIAPNDGAANRKRNRRIEITVLPNIAEVAR
jgi:chemotaxis protein MotB